MNSYVLTPATGVVVKARQKRKPAIVVFAGGLNDQLPRVPDCGASRPSRPT